MDNNIKSKFKLSKMKYDTIWISFHSIFVSEILINNIISQCSKQNFLKHIFIFKRSGSTKTIRPFKQPHKEIRDPPSPFSGSFVLGPSKEWREQYFDKNL